MSEHEQWFKNLNANGKTVYFLGNEHKVSKMAWDFQQAKIDELCKQMEDALFSMRQQALMLREDMDGYKDPAQICQSEGVDICVGILEKALRGASDQHLTR